MLMMQRKPWLITAFATLLVMGGMLLVFPAQA